MCQSANNFISFEGTGMPEGKFGRKYMFGLFARIKKEAKLGAYVANVVENLVVRFDYRLRERDKEVLFDLGREFGDELTPFELALFFISRFGCQRYPKDEGNSSLKAVIRWIDAVKKAKQENLLADDQATEFIKSVAEHYGIALDTIET